MPRQNPAISLLASRFGIVYPGAIDYRDSVVGMDTAQALLAQDAAPSYAAQSPLVTLGNSGIPAYLANYLDPELVRVLVAPPRFAEIYGEAKKGDWTTKTALFPIIESGGEVSSYGDYNNNGSSSANANWEPRQAYHYQAFTRWGDQELEMAGLAKIDWASEQNIACALNFMIFQNKTYAYGVTGLDNFGWLNDPSLNAYITPSTKTAGGTTWAVASGQEIWNDILALFVQLQAQLKGNAQMSDKVILALSPLIQPYLLKLVTVAGVASTSTVEDYFKKSFPNGRIETATEYSTTSGEIIQMSIEQVRGQKLGFCAFTEKMRVHAVVRDTSSTHQKKSAGSWGAIIKLPAAIAQGIGY